MRNVTVISAATGAAEKFSGTFWFCKDHSGWDDIRIQKEKSTVDECRQPRLMPPRMRWVLPVRPGYVRRRYLEVRARPGLRGNWFPGLIYPQSADLVYFRAF